jgi:hypothetical protein
MTTNDEIQNVFSKHGFLFCGNYNSKILVGDKNL